MNEKYGRRKTPRRKARVAVRYLGMLLRSRLKDPPAWLYALELVVVLLLATLSLLHDEGNSVPLLALMGFGL